MRCYKAFNSELRDVAALSCPYEVGRLELVGSLALSFFSRIAQYVASVERFRNSAEGNTLSNISRRAVCATPSVSYWEWEIGAIGKALSKTHTWDLDGSWVEAQLLIAAFMAGLINELEFEADVNNPLLVSGLYVSSSLLLSVAASGSKLTIKDRRGEILVELVRQVARNGIPVWVDSRRYHIPVTFGTKYAMSVASSHWTWNNGKLRPKQEICEKLESVVEALERAGAFLEQEVPEYYEWIGGAVTLVVPIARPSADVMVSGSDFYSFRMCQIGFPATNYELCEMLVHESSHQYFNLLRTAGPLQRNSTSLHRSPLRSQPRQLDRILIGYHAFANVRLLYRKIQERCGTCDVEPLVKSVESDLAQLDCVLVENIDNGLTECGKNLYLPLALRLRARRAKRA